MSKTPKPKSKKKSNNKTNSALQVVGIGTSAGGLEALESFFNNCPTNTGLAFVIVQHLSPDHKSLMTELLSRHTKMPVTEAKEELLVEPDHIYLIPGNKNLTIKGGKLQLTRRPTNNQINFSIDIFFNSLATEQKERSIAIILSGTGSDGTRGGKSIKEVGGTVFVQSPESSRFDGMPRSAISSGIADYVLSTVEMPNELVQFVSHPQFAKGITSTDLGEDLESIDRVLKILKTHTGFDFFSYKKPTLLRRTAKRINITKCKSVKNYIEYLYDNPDEKFILVDEFLIGVTKFFRDTAAFQILEKKIIPEIVQMKTRRKMLIKVWVVACSTGEEAYSVAMFLEEYIRKNELNIKYKIFATDIDGKSIEQAAKGMYPENIALDISQTRLNKFFVRKNNYYQVDPQIRKNIIFSKHDIIHHPPFNKMDLISCRNMLIYLDNKSQQRVLARLHYALNPDGYLFMGGSETIGPLSKSFEEISSKWKIYKNIRPTKTINIAEGNSWQMEDRYPRPVNRGRVMPTFEDTVVQSVNKTLMNEVNAVSVCVDENYEIVHASGNFKRYVTIPDEGFSNNILKILEDDLVIPISTAIRKLAIKNEKEPIVKNIKLLKGENIRQLRLLIQMLDIGLHNYRSYLVTIIEKVERPLTDSEKAIVLPSAEVKSKELKDLRDALAETREDLQATIEELETSNEEMQATNEELMAANEELQSTNEELQSLNEELHTVNAELQEKNVQLIEANSDIKNLMVNTNIGTIFLDREFNIRKFTPKIKEHFQLREADLGRPIQHFSGTMGGADLITYSRKVLDQEKPVRVEFQSGEGTWFMLQVFPYRTESNVIQGVVINFINIHELKTSLEEKAEANKYISHLTTASPTILYVFDLQKKINVFSSKSIGEIAGYNTDEIKAMGNQLIPTIVHPDDLMKVFQHQLVFENLSDDETAFVEYRLVHKKTGNAIWILSVEKIHERDEHGKPLLVLGSAHDITRFKDLESKLKESEERSRLAIKATGAAIGEWNINKGKEVWLSVEAHELLGYNPKRWKPTMDSLMKLVYPDHKEKLKEEMISHLDEQTLFEEEVKLKTKKKGYRWFRINVQGHWDKEDKLEKVVGIVFDINDRYLLKEAIAEKEARLSSIYDNAPIGIILTNEKGTILEASKGITTILGYQRDELRKKSFLTISHNEDISDSKSIHLKLSKDETLTIQKDKRYVAKDKKVIWCSVTVGSIKVQEDGRSENYRLAILSDINDRKLAENKLKLMNKELERFAYSASHDLKEPLRTITSLTERLTEKFEDKMEPKALKYVGLIEGASKRMQSVTDGLLIYSRLGRKVERYESVNLNQLIKKLKVDLGSSIKEKSATIDVSRLPKVYGDPMQIRLLFQNLISNGLKYQKKSKAKIEIGYINKGDHWEFFVKDNGIGIAKKNHEVVFEVFKRLHNKEEYEGTGIGLSSCKRIVENHGGKIWLKSSLGRGATFFFTIPKKPIIKKG